MPNDLVSREAAVASAMEAITYTYIGRQWASTDDLRFMATMAVAAAIANLPAAGDERWEKLRARIKSLEQSWVGVESDSASAHWLAYSRCIDELDRLSPPPQEAGDEPGE